MFTFKSTSSKTLFGIGAAIVAANTVSLPSSGVASANIYTVSGSGWNVATTASNGTNGSGAWVETSSSNTPALSYGAYAAKSTGTYNNSGLDSASAGYSSSYGGSAKLTVNDSAYWTASYVGLNGFPAGILRYTTMSFQVANNSSNNASAHPYAIMDIGTGANTFDVINMESGSGAYSITGSSTVSIWDNSTNAWVVGNGSGTSFALSSIYNNTDTAGTEYGNLPVTWALANIGSFGSSGNNETAYINSMAITTPEPATLGLFGLGGAGLLLLGRKRKAIA